MNVTLVTVGQTKEKALDALCAAYETRLKPDWTFSRRIIRPAYLPENPGEKEIAAALEKEAEEIRSFLDTKKRSVKVALCVEGKALKSEEFARFIGERMLQSGEFIFLIGSSFGLSERVKALCDLKLSLSAMTLPHELARLFFTEQLYRAKTILDGKKYHK